MLQIKLTDIVIIVLILVLFLQRCGGDTDTAGPKIIRDTVWVYHDTTIRTKPQIIKTEPYGVPVDRWNTEYLPDTNYSKLLSQYESVVRDLLAKNIHSDSIKIDSIGHIYITDTVSRNVILGRSTYYNLKYPVITNTIIVPEKKKNQWYFGGSIQGQQTEPVNAINAGLLIKNKKDQIFGGYVGLNTTGQLQFGVQSYWKIKLK